MKALSKIKEDLLFYITKYKSRKYDSFVINTQDPQELHFAFFGEFGFGLQAWLPYVKFIKENTPHSIHTHGPQGSSSFYTFSDSHTEHSNEFNDISLGHVLKYIKLKNKIGKEIIFPSNQTKKIININGFHWSNNNSTGDISDVNYSTLNHKITPLPFEQKEPFVVINNKNYYNWSNSAVVNFFKNIELYDLANTLADKGINMVYNAFPDAETEENMYVDQKVDFAGHSNVTDMRPIYEQTSDPNEKNRMQLSLFAHSEFVIAVQGGNAILPITCKKDTFILMRGGFDYPFYKSLEKIYKISSNCFYEPEHLVSNIFKD